MRLGFFTSIEGWGGSETYLLSLMKGVREAGHHPVLFGVEGARLWMEAGTYGIERVAWRRIQPPEDIQRYRHGGASIPPRVKQSRLALLMPGWLRLFLGNAREVASLVDLFRQHRVDVMHVSNSGYEVAGISCRLCGIPSLVMNMITPPWEAWWIRRWLMKFSLKFYNHVSSQSAYCTKEWIRLACLPPQRCSHVWNGVDLSRFVARDKVRSRTATDVFRIVSVGRLHPMKGLKYLIEAISVANDARLRLDIVGEGTLLQELTNLVKSLGVEKQVFFSGYDEHPERRLKEADCFALASISHESCPAVLPEAMACGLPLVTSDFGPLAEVNVNGETGMVVPCGDSQRLASALSSLADDPVLAGKFGDAGRRRAVLFSREVMVDRMLAQYAGLSHSQVRQTS